MKFSSCITYGWLIILLMLLSIISGILGAADARLGTGVMVVGTLGLLFWWLFGFVVDCDDYYGKVIQNPDDKRMFGE